MTSMPAARLAETFVKLADTLVGDFDVDEFLRFLASRARETLSADASGVVLADLSGHLRTVADCVGKTSSAPLWELLRADGPSMECYRTGTPIAVPDVDQHNNRWNRFLQEARSAGFAALHAVPLRLRDTTIGALTLFHARRGTPDSEDARIAEAMAEAAAIALLQQRAVQREETLAKQLQAAFTSRILIEQAKGVLAERLGTTVDAAFTALREHARRSNQRLTELANAVLSGSTDLPRE
ncbi:ANTAR domain-containing protein [Kutzneria albida]|uniref:ANTAR domain-containing protein n=2 Tax=Kutzneria TaxID=43356 RepID=W5W4M6_9PSEU|nr:GAF and ANTAR domain-containing protein [Kutzneria albida]AHH95431.1 hypothetical protein KALB_2062 [Kutzneria albida DSM 43870]